MSEFRPYRGRGRGRGHYHYLNNFRNPLYNSEIRRPNNNLFPPNNSQFSGLSPLPQRFRDNKTRWSHTPFAWRPPQHMPYPPHHIRPFNPFHKPPLIENKPNFPLPGSEEARQKAIAEASARIKEQLNLTQNDSDQTASPFFKIDTNLESPSFYENVNFKQEPPLNDNNSFQLPLKAPDKKKKPRRMSSSTISSNVEEYRQKILTCFTSMSKGRIQNLVNNPGSTKYDNAVQHLIRDMRINLSSELRTIHNNRERESSNENEIIDRFNLLVPDLGVELASLPDTVIEELSKVLQLDEEITTPNDNTSDSSLIQPEDMFKQAEQLLTNTNFITNDRNFLECQPQLQFQPFENMNTSYTHLENNELDCKQNIVSEEMRSNLCSLNDKDNHQNLSKTFISDQKHLSNILLPTPKNIEPYSNQLIQSKETEPLFYESPVYSVPPPDFAPNNFNLRENGTLLSNIKEEYSVKSILKNPNFNPSLKYSPNSTNTINLKEPILENNSVKIFPICQPEVSTFTRKLQECEDSRNQEIIFTNQINPNLMESFDKTNQKKPSNRASVEIEKNLNSTESKTSENTSLFNFDSVWITKPNITNYTDKETVVGVVSPSSSSSTNLISVLKNVSSNKFDEQKKECFITYCDKSCDSILSNNIDSTDPKKMRTRSSSPLDLSKISSIKKIKNKKCNEKKRISLDERIRQMMNIKNEFIQKKKQTEHLKNSESSESSDRHKKVINSQKIQNEMLKNKKGIGPYKTETSSSKEGNTISKHAKGLNTIQTVNILNSMPIVNTSIPGSDINKIKQEKFSPQELETRENLIYSNIQTNTHGIPIKPIHYHKSINNKNVQSNSQLNIIIKQEKNVDEIITNKLENKEEKIKICEKKSKISDNSIKKIIEENNDKQLCSTSDVKICNNRSEISINEKNNNKNLGLSVNIENPDLVQSALIQGGVNNTENDLQENVNVVNKTINNEVTDNSDNKNNNTEIITDQRRIETENKNTSQNNFQLENGKLTITDNEIRSSLENKNHEEQYATNDQSNILCISLIPKENKSNKICTNKRNNKQKTDIINSQPEVNKKIVSQSTENLHQESFKINTNTTKENNDNHTNSSSEILKNQNLKKDKQCNEGKKLEENKVNETKHGTTHKYKSSSSIYRSHSNSDKKTSSSYNKSDDKSAKSKDRKVDSSSSKDKKYSHQSSSHSHRTHNSSDTKQNKSSNSNKEILNVNTKESIITRLWKIDLQIDNLMKEKWKLYKELNLINANTSSDSNETQQTINNITSNKEVISHCTTDIEKSSTQAKEIQINLQEKETRNRKTETIKKQTFEEKHIDIETEIELKQSRSVKRTNTNKIQENNTKLLGNESELDSENDTNESQKRKLLSLPKTIKRNSAPEQNTVKSEKQSKTKIVEQQKSLYPEIKISESAIFSQSLNNSETSTSFPDYKTKAAVKEIPNLTDPSVLENLTQKDSQPNKPEIDINYLIPKVNKTVKRKRRNAEDEIIESLKLSDLDLNNFESELCPRNRKTKRNINKIDNTTIVSKQKQSLSDFSINDSESDTHLKNPKKRRKTINSEKKIPQRNLRRSNNRNDKNLPSSTKGRENQSEIENPSTGNEENNINSSEMDLLIEEPNQLSDELSNPALESILTNIDNENILNKSENEDMEIDNKFSVFNETMFKLITDETTISNTSTKLNKNSKISKVQSKNTSNPLLSNRFQSSCYVKLERLNLSKLNESESKNISDLNETETSQMQVLNNCEDELPFNDENETLCNNEEIIEILNKCDDIFEDSIHINRKENFILNENQTIANNIINEEIGMNSEEENIICTYNNDIIEQSSIKNKIEKPLANVIKVEEIVNINMVENVEDINISGRIFSTSESTEKMKNEMYNMDQINVDPNLSTNISQITVMGKEIDEKILDKVSVKSQEQNISNETDQKAIADIKSENSETDLNYIDTNGIFCEGHKKSILDIKILGNEFLAASEDGTIYKYCLETGCLQDAYTGHRRAVTCIYVVNGKEQNIDANLFYSGSLDCTLKCYNIDTAEILHNITVAQAIQCMDSAWGYIFLGTYDGLLFIYDLKKQLLREDSLTIANSTVLMIKATQEGSRQVLILASRKREIMVRDAFTGLLLRTMCQDQKPTIYSLLLDRSIVYCGTSDKGILLLDFNSGAQKGFYKSGKGVVCMLIYKSLLFAGCYDGFIYVYNTRTHELITTIPGPEESMLLSLAIHNDVIIAGTKKEHLLKIWRIPQKILNQAD